MEVDPSRRVGSLFDPPASIFELSAKALTALGAAALATAFIYDAIHYQWFDKRLLGVFALSDHIETAVYCVVTIAISWGFLALMTYFKLYFPSGSGFRAWSRNRRLIYIAIMAAIIAMPLIAIFGRDYRQPWEAYDRRVVDLVLFVFGWSTLTWTSKQIGAGNRKGLFVSLPLCWVLLTVFYASTSAMTTLRELNSANAKFNDAITFVDQGQLFGSVIRILDKGVIVATPNPVRFMFIPKDRISRVDLGS